MKRHKSRRAALACLLLSSAVFASAEPLGRDVRFDEVDYRVVEIDLAQDRLELHWRDADGQPLASIDGLRRWGGGQGRDLLFATNAGIYDRQFRPLGLHVEDGKTLRPLNTVLGAAAAGNFSIRPNGVFYIDQQGSAGVMKTSDWHARNIDARLATQSGPMLVVDGEINTSFDEHSDSLKWRSGVCAKTPHQAVFAVSQAPVTFHTFARLFRDRLGCSDALYLDGTLSRIYTKADGYAGAAAMMVKPYAGMLAVFAELPAARRKGD